MSLGKKDSINYSTISLMCCCECASNIDEFVDVDILDEIILESGGYIIRR